MSEAISATKSYLNRKKVDIFARQYSEILTQKKSLTINFNFDNKWWNNRTVIYGLNWQLNT